MVLLLITVATGAYTYSQRSMWGYAISPADLAQLEELAAKPALASQKVGVLDFDNLTVRCAEPCVPLTQGRVPRRAGARVVGGGVEWSRGCGCCCTGGRLGRLPARLPLLGLLARV